MFETKHSAELLESCAENGGNLKHLHVLVSKGLTRPYVWRQRPDFSSTRLHVRLWNISKARFLKVLTLFLSGHDVHTTQWLSSRVLPNHSDFLPIWEVKLRQVGTFFYSCLSVSFLTLFLVSANEWIDRCSRSVQSFTGRRLSNSGDPTFLEDSLSVMKKFYLHHILILWYLPSVYSFCGLVCTSTEPRDIVMHE